MNIFKTPKPSDIVLKHLDSDNSLDWPIIRRYPGYEKCFLAFHPFLIVKDGGENIKVPYQPFPKKSEIVKNYDKLTWSSFLEISGIKDIKNLDDCLAYYHRARRVTNKNEFKRLIAITENENNSIVEAQVDCLPGIIEDAVLNYFVKKGHTELYIYDDIYDEKILFKISSLFNSELNVRHHVRIESSDHKILIVEDFDERFTYFLGSRNDIEKLIGELDLEGFYCDDYTTSDWSYNILDNELTISWEEEANMRKM